MSDTGTVKRKRKIKGTDEKSKTRSVVGTKRAESPIPELPSFTEKPNYISRTPNGPKTRTPRVKSTAATPKNPDTKAPSVAKETPMAIKANGPKTRSRGSTADSASYSGPKARGSAKAPEAKSAGMSYNGSQSQAGPKKTTTNTHYNRARSPSSATQHNASQDASHTKKPIPATAHKPRDTAESLLARSRYNGTGGLTSHRRK